MITGDDSLVTLSRLVLSSIESSFSTHGIALPDRRYVTIGTPVNDAEQLVVSYLQHYQGAPGDEASTPQTCHVPRSAVLSVSLVRCMPTEDARNRPPSASDIQTASEALLVDAYVLTETLINTDPMDLGTIVTCEVGDVSGGLATIVAQTILGIP